MEKNTIQLEKEVNPAHIFEVGMGFWASKTLLTAIKLGLFTYLNDNQAHTEEIRIHLGLDQRSIYDFLDALVAMGFLNREGLGYAAFYENTAETALFLDKNKPGYVGGILEMSNDRLYNFWGNLEEALITGKPQNEVKNLGKPVFEAIYSDPTNLQQFMDAMAGTQIGNFKALTNSFPFEQYNSLCDIGGANAMLSVLVAQKHSHLQITSVDLPAVAPIASHTVQKFGLTERIRIDKLDMLTEPFPKADIITMGNILHDWNLEIKKQLIRKAYEALPEKGALVVIENIIDDDRKQNVFGLLMSLNMLIETDGGFDYSHADFHHWAIEAGFRSTTKIALGGPASAVVAYK